MAVGARVPIRLVEPLEFRCNTLQATKRILHVSGAIVCTWRCSQENSHQKQSNPDRSLSLVRVYIYMKN